LLGRLRNLLGSSPKPRYSRVAQPGARPQKVDTRSLSRPDEGFGKRKPRNH
jgi:hypothetical protein